MSTFHQYWHVKAASLPADKQQKIASALIETAQASIDKAVQLLDTLIINFDASGKITALTFERFGPGQTMPILMQAEFTEDIRKAIADTTPTGYSQVRGEKDTLIKLHYAKVRALDEQTKAALAKALIPIIAEDEDKQRLLLVTVKIHFYPKSKQPACIAFEFSGHEAVPPILSEFELNPNLLKALEDIKPDTQTSVIRNPNI